MKFDPEIHPIEVPEILSLREKHRKAKENTLISTLAASSFVGSILIFEALCDSRTNVIIVTSVIFFLTNIIGSRIANYHHIRTQMADEILKMGRRAETNALSH